MVGSMVESRGGSMVEFGVLSRVLDRVQSAESMAESRGIQRDTDQQGRWSLPARGARVMRLQVRSIQHSMQHSALCTPYSALCTPD